MKPWNGCLRTVWLAALLAVACCELAIAGQPGPAEEPLRDPSHQGRYLLICAGDQARKAPDFRAVINFDEDSPNYGKVLATPPVPAPDATENDFHHIGISADGKTAACGGLLSILKGQK